ncbi:MAG: lytic transglycosylase domain-containing protein [Candidatus Levybacteria bacterium]|nr:lytic transglycosylase domain-containing protein [Candidatus Levybacteria bacterium]
MEGGEGQGRKPPKVTRRLFIKALGGTAGGAAAGVVLGGFLASQKDRPKSSPQIISPEVLVPTPRPTEVPPVKLPAQYTALFENANDTEKLEAKKMVEEEMLFYRNRGDYKEIVAQSSAWTPIVKEAATLLGFRHDSPVPKLLPALIFVESEGVASAKNPKSGAEGLCQIKQGTARDMFKRLIREYESKKSVGIKTALDKIAFNHDRTINLTDPFTNVALSLEYLDFSLNYFPNTGLGFWAFHLGLGNGIQAVAAWAGIGLLEGKQMVEDIKVYERAGGVLDKVSALVRKSKLNVVNLLGSDAVVERLKKIDAFNDNTEKYTARIGAAAMLLS